MMLVKMRKPPKTKRLDPLTPRERSERMGRVRSANTGPELELRRLVFALGYRYRLHDRTLPGKPDMVFTTRRAVIFVHGCFWHQHGCGTYKMPASRPDFWLPKLQGNAVRDERVQTELATAGWRVLAIWECELRGDPLALGFRILDFLEAPTSVAR